MRRLCLLAIGALLLGLASCSRAPQPADSGLAARVVGKWKLVRESGKPSTVSPPATGLIEFRADGTITYEEITQIEVNGKADPPTAKQSQGKYRFLDGETIEIEGEDRGQVKTWSVKAAVKDKVLTLHKPYGQVDEFERVP